MISPAPSIHSPRSSDPRPGPRAVPLGVVGFERSVVIRSHAVGGVAQDVSSRPFARSTSLVGSSVDGTRAGIPVPPMAASYWGTAA